MYGVEAPWKTTGSVSMDLKCMNEVRTKCLNELFDICQSHIAVCENCIVKLKVQSVGRPIQNKESVNQVWYNYLVFICAMVDLHLV